MSKRKLKSSKCLKLLPPTLYDTRNLLFNVFLEFSGCNFEIKGELNAMSLKTAYSRRQMITLQQEWDQVVRKVRTTHTGCNKIIAPCTRYTKKGIFYFCNRSNRLIYMYVK